jgi:hypothetical protein
MVAVGGTANSVVSLLLSVTTKAFVGASVFREIVAVVAATPAFSATAAATILTVSAEISLSRTFTVSLPFAYPIAEAVIVTV